MKHIISSLFLSLLLLLTTTAAVAQERSTQLTIQVASVPGDNLYGQPVTLMQTDYQVSYGSLSLNGEGACSLKVYAGNHRLTIVRDGFNTLSYDFAVATGEAEKTVSVTLTEQTRTPFALTTKVSHNAYDGTNSIDFSWNVEAPAFFDDFESYSPFAIQFGQWTGIDADNEAAAPLVGSYPNRGVMQYAQIINPMKVDPIWWYDYPILRPYAGQQYVGFTRTSSGNANDDWLISPAITVGTDNVLSFMAKAADRYPERFMVYVTTVLDNPVASDFVRLDQGNYETADYTGWKMCIYNLSAYAGQQVKFAIRYISHYNSYGSFMLMVDDVYVGQPTAAQAAYMPKRLHRAAAKSPANPNETFSVYLDGVLAGTTDSYSYTLTGVASGTHTIGVKAHYLQAESELATVSVDVPAADSYAAVTFRVTTNSVLTADGQQLSLTSMETSESYELTVAGGQAVLPSLPRGAYAVNIAEGAFEAYQQTIEVTADATIDIALADRILAPYNITAKADTPEGDPSGDPVYTLRWNQQLQFTDSFEDYDDFATGSFGGWKTVDADQQPVYPVALGSQANIVSFPGSGTATVPTAIAPMVFNPWNTTPPMLPTDPAIKAPTGDKSVIFFSAQMALNDKWLISPAIDINQDYVLTVTAKGYSSMYPETITFCVSTDSNNPDDFVALSKVDQLSSEQWTIYQTDLSAYAGQTVYLAVHYTSYDAFLAQVDDFTVGPASGEGETVDYGNVINYEVTVDGQLVASPTVAQCTLPALSAGTHTIAIRAIYKSGASQWTEYTLDTTTGIVLTAATPASDRKTVYSLSGQYVGHSMAALPAGIYLVKQNGIIRKVRK